MGIDVYQLGRHVYDSPSGLACVEGVFFYGGGGEGERGREDLCLFPLHPLPHRFLV